MYPVLQAGTLLPVLCDSAFHFCGLDVWCFLWLRPLLAWTISSERAFLAWIGQLVPRTPVRVILGQRCCLLRYSLRLPLLGFAVSVAKHLLSSMALSVPNL
jgi:hypothetical protein